MHLKKLFFLAALVSGFALTGCGLVSSDELKSCTADEFCDEDSVCHPLAKVCVKACESATDCPSSAKSCTGVSGTRTFCQCQSTDLCDGGDDVICTDEEKICAPKCTSDVDCSMNRRCDKATGNCRAN